MTLSIIIIIYLNSKLFYRPILPFKITNTMFNGKLNICNIIVLYVALNDLSLPHNIN